MEIDKLLQLIVNKRLATNQINVLRVMLSKKVVTTAIIVEETGLGIQPIGVIFKILMLKNIIDRNVKDNRTYEYYIKEEVLQWLNQIY